MAIKTRISRRYEMSYERRGTSNSFYYRKCLYINETECKNSLPLPLTFDLKINRGLLLEIGCKDMKAYC